MYFNIEISILD